MQDSQLPCAKKIDPSIKTLSTSIVNILFILTELFLLCYLFFEMWAKIASNEPTYSNAVYVIPPLMIALLVTHLVRTRKLRKSQLH